VCVCGVCVCDHMHAHMYTQRTRTQGIKPRVPCLGCSLTTTHTHTHTHTHNTHTRAQGIKLGVSSRGWASLRTDARAKCVFVDDDFELITFDFVTEPSTKV